MTAQKVLLAEDDQDDQQIFADFLNDRADIELLPPVENGEALFQSLEAASDIALLPDMIILDQNMPKKNGLQTLKELKSNKRYAHIPVMIYSTYADNALVVAATGLGASKVSSKPVTRKEYNRMMDEFLQKEKEDEG